MSKMTSNKLNEKNNISISKIFEELNEIFNIKNYNQIKPSILNDKEVKIFHFVLNWLKKTTKYKDIKKLINLNKKYFKKNNDHIILNVDLKTKNLSKILIFKFFTICIINSYKLYKILNYDNKKIFIQKLYQLIQIYYVNNIIDKECLVKILKLELMNCFYKEEERVFNEDLLKIKNEEIKNIYPLETVINFLLSFNSIKMNNNEIFFFTNIINDIMEEIKELFLNNCNNIYLLSNSLLFYRLLELSQISLDIIVNIIPVLIKVYKFNFNLNYLLNDLSSQFLLKKDEYIIRKNNNIIAKNNFLYELFKYEILSTKEENNNIIKNGFVFNDKINNGIILYNNESFTFPNESFSSVISFKLLKYLNKEKKDIKNNEKDNNKYPLYSLVKKEGNIDFNIFIQNNTLKMNILGKLYDLYNEIEYNKTYVLWHFHYGNNKKGTSEFFLNGKQVIKKGLSFHKEFYNINIGFDNVSQNNKDKNNKNQNNFVGIIGTYILFNNCLIKDDKSDNKDKDIREKFVKDTLFDLKCNYENIIYINYITDLSFLNEEVTNLLKKFLSDDISRFIEVIISSKSITNNNFFYNNKERKFYKANYFMDKDNDKSVLCFNSDIDINCNSNNLITFPIHFINTFDNFINNNGMKFLSLELYYFIGVMGSYSIINNTNANLNIDKNNDTEKNKKIIYQIKNELDNEIKELKNEKNYFYLKLINICNLFLYCLQSMKETQYKNNEHDIENFFNTLNDLISLSSKNEFKIDLMFLTSIINHLNLLINNNLFFNYFGFIFEYENYEENDDKVFQFLFQTILIYLDQYNTNFLTVDIFSKILDFDKLYIEGKVNKNTRRIYSQLIRKCISLSLLNNDEECFMIYFQKLRKLAGINKKKDLSINCNYISEEELSEDSDTIYNPKISHKNSTIDKNMTLKNENIKNTPDEKQQTSELKLVYKYLKNLYLSLEIDIKTSDILMEFCAEKDENINGFFNELFKYISNNYDISIPMDDIDNNTNNIQDNNINENLKICELIKSLCIRFIDEINYNKNSKNITNELREKKHSKENSNTFTNKIFKSISSFNLVTSKKNNIQNNIDQINDNNLNLNSAQNLLNKMEIGNDSIDSIIINKFEFFNFFTISPYTFNSFFVSLFRDMTYKNKLKFIKNINKKNEKLYLSEKLYIIIRFYCRIIIQLIQRVDEEENDTIFMSKYELFEYTYDLFNDLLLNMLDYFFKKEKNKKEKIDKKFLKSMINNLFCSKENAFNFYKIVFADLKNQRGENIQISQSVVINQDKNKLKIFERNFYEKVKKNIYIIIDKTIYELIDPFYFKLLFEIYIKDPKEDINCKYVIDVMEYMIKKFDDFANMDHNETKLNNKVVEFNNKNLLLLIYKIIFYISKREFLIKNKIFIKSIVLYLLTFVTRTKIIFLKLIFSIEETVGTNKIKNKKLIIEMLFEIYIELYLEFKKLSKKEDDENTKREYEKQGMLFEEQIIQLLMIKNTSSANLDKNIFLLFESFVDLEEDNKSKKKKKKKTWEYSICYMIDKLSIIQNKDLPIQNSKTIYITFEKLNSLKEYVLEKYKKEYSKDENEFSVTIVFLIKLTLYIKKLEKYDKNSNLQNFLINFSEILCKDALRLHQKYTDKNPLVSKSENQTIIYEDFKYYIINEYNLNKKYNKDDLIIKITDNKDAIKYNHVEYTSGTEKSKLSKSKNHEIIIVSDKRRTFYKGPSYFSLGENSSFSRNSIRDERNDHSSFNIFDNSGKSYKSSKTLTNDLRHQSYEKIDLFRVSSAFFLKKKEKKKLLEYKITPKFLKNFVRNKFSLHFLKLLTYDEDFINVKKIYYYLYNKEISDIKKYNLNYPSKLKNRLGNNYTKHFLKKDFNFISSEYFQYSHNCIKERNFTPKTKILFPPKTILEEYDFSHKNTIINKDDSSILSKDCELITYEGAIFGHIYIFQNCILFKSDIENDKRKIQNLECVCCSMEFDFLNKKKTRIIELTEIKEVINRKFIYAWISLEIFMKNGYSHLFNFFNEEANNEILELFKSFGIPVIRNIKEYFEKENYIKNWKEGKISTYNYLLILNKFSSRSYNDLNQYPVMPWIFMQDKNIRNFDIPMSIQDEETKERFLKIPFDKSENENRWHSNHYSTSAYICYYLMRTNPYTESMIKFQSNSFDVPDRQFFDISQTLILCEKNNNNREPIPELYTIPEVYINLNNNDFGKQSQRERGRIHNVEFKPYASNAYEFYYIFRFMLNSNEEVNTKINEWFDFIFGINQYNSDNQKGKGLRNFNKHSYAQNIDIRKIINDLKKNKETDSKIYDKIKEVLGMVISFGQCPYQLLTYEHPKRKYNKGINEYMLSSIENISEQDLNSNSSINKTNGNIECNETKENNEYELKIMPILYDYKNKKYNIIYFRKSIYNDNLYCLCNNKEIEIYQKEGRTKEYKFKKKINISKNYLLFRKNEKGYPILKPKYLFCELKQENFIFCRYLDDSIRVVLPPPNSELKFLLDSFITCIIRINEKEFITGDNIGKIFHWSIDFDNILEPKLKLIKMIESNNNCITSILYNERLNLVISSDNNSVVIRSFYDFEFLTYFNIGENEKNCENDIVVDIKLSNYDLLYVLIYNENDNYKLKGYSLNGICFGEYKEKISNFELTEEGRVIVGLSNQGIINVLNPINFKIIYSQYISDEKSLFYHFYFEKPNIIYFGIKNKEGSKIKIFILNEEEMRNFI